MVRLVLVSGLVSLASTTAHAQQPVVSEIVEGGGVKVGEGTVIHPIVGIETGIVQNVFYEDENTRFAGLMRLIAELAVGSLPSERMQPVSQEESKTQNFGDLALRADGHFEYEEYLSSNDNVQAQRNFAFAVAANGLVFPKQTWQFLFGDELRRETRPVNFESSDRVNRDINRLQLKLRFRPRGRTLSGSLGYTNVIDYFEDEDQQFANRIQHTATLQAQWQWLPMTRITADLALGFFRPFGSESTRIPSMPLRATAGIASAITVKTTLNAFLGFGKGFYESGPDFTNIIGGVQAGYRFSPQSRLSVGYEYDFRDSINANFYRDHAISGRLEQQIDRFAINAGAEFRLRKYSGIIAQVNTMDTDRNDLIFSVPIGATYNFRNWIAATADYRFTTVQTDFVYEASTGEPDDPSFTQHVLMLGVRAAY